MLKYLPGYLACSAAPPSISTLPSVRLAEHRLGDDLVELVHHLLFEMVGALRQRHLAGDLAGSCGLRSHVASPCSFRPVIRLAAQRYTESRPCDTESAVGFHAKTGIMPATKEPRTGSGNGMPHIEIRDVSLVYDTPAGQVAGVAERKLQHRAVGIPLHRRAVGLRQVDAAQHHRRLPHADRRRDPHRRQGGDRPRPGPRRGVPGFRAAVSVAHRARQRHLRPGDEGHRQGRARGASRASSSSWSSSRNSPTPIRTICRAACSSASRSRARSPTIRRCC